LGGDGEDRKEEGGTNRGRSDSLKCKKEVARIGGLGEPRGLFTGSIKALQITYAEGAGFLGERIGKKKKEPRNKETRATRNARGR